MATHVGAPERLHIDQSGVPRDADCPAPNSAGDVVSLRNPVDFPGWSRRLGDVALNEFEGKLLVWLD